jgi:hypothetical protein
MKPYSHVNSALSWGLGWGIEEEGGPRYLWQWGDNGGWKNIVMVHPESRSALVVFTNGGNGMRVVERVAKAATGRDHSGCRCSRDCLLFGVPRRSHDPSIHAYPLDFEEKGVVLCRIRGCLL